MEAEKLNEHINKMTEKQKTSTLILIVVAIFGELNSKNMEILVDKILEQEVK